MNQICWMVQVLAIIVVVICCTTTTAFSSPSGASTRSRSVLQRSNVNSNPRFSRHSFVPSYRSVPLLLPTTTTTTTTNGHLQLIFASNTLLTKDSGNSSSNTRSTAVYALMLGNLVVFLLDKVFGYSFVSKNFYLFHRRWKWWQPLTSCFCHADRLHLSNNLFLLLLFGRSVEDDQGWGGLLLSYLFCGVAASLVSILLLPKYTISIGASGAVFGLFAVSTLAKLTWQDLDWRKIVEVAVLGEFVFRQLASEISTAAGGGRAGINHVAHLSGAGAGALLVFGMRVTVSNFDRKQQQTKKQSKDIKKGSS